MKEPRDAEEERKETRTEGKKLREEEVEEAAAGRKPSAGNTMTADEGKWRGWGGGRG